MILIIAVLSLASLLPQLSFSGFHVRSGADSQPKSDDKAWFLATEQSLMDAIAVGDKAVWDRVLDKDCIMTTEEGQTFSKEQLLKELTGLPPGLSGSIKVEDFTVQEFPTFAVVRFLANEQEDVFGQQLKTKYRVTDTFRKDGSQWKMIASHLSVVTADPPPQDVPKENWPGLVGVYKLMPSGWTFNVVLRNGELLGGRDLTKLRPMIPLAPNVFVTKGALGEKIFIIDKNGKASKIVDFRKFQPLIWNRVSD
jgi:hypothetical protein